MESQSKTRRQRADGLFQCHGQTTQLLRKTRMRGGQSVGLSHDREHILWNRGDKQRQWSLDGYPIATQQPVQPQLLPGAPLR